MKKTFIQLACGVLLLGFGMVFTTSIQSCRKKDIVKPDTTVLVKEPFIYIYPKEDISLKIDISFPQGGAVVASIPAYQNGWAIDVDSAGKIDKTYNNLFYESEQPDKWQYKSGWIVQNDSLMAFFQKNMSDYGFISKEIKDFTDYWVPKLKKYPFYMIYPQEIDLINQLVKVNYSVKPDNELRLFYAVKGVNEKTDIVNQIVPSGFKREGFYVAEWGVITK